MRLHESKKRINLILNGYYLLYVFTPLLICVNAPGNVNVKPKETNKATTKKRCIFGERHKIIELVFLSEHDRNALAGLLGAAAAAGDDAGN